MIEVISEESHSGYCSDKNYEIILIRDSRIIIFNAEESHSGYCNSLENCNPLRGSWVRVPPPPHNKKARLLRRAFLLCCRDSNPRGGSVGSLVFAKQNHDLGDTWCSLRVGNYS